MTAGALEEGCGTLEVKLDGFALSKKVFVLKKTPKQHYIKKKNILMKTLTYIKIVDEAVGDSGTSTPSWVYNPRIAGGGSTY